MFEASYILPSFAVKDIGVAREFYGDTLGLDVEEIAMGVDGNADIPRGLEIRGPGGVRVLAYPKPDHEPAGFTVLNITVPDIDAAVASLSGRGILFEHYETSRTDENGIHRTPEVHAVAWFRDPSGNVLSLIEESQHGGTIRER